MKKRLIVLGLVLIWLDSTAQLAISRTALCLTRNGQTDFWITSGNPPTAFAPLPAFAGVFGTRSKSLQLQGAWTQVNAPGTTSVCSATLSFLMYRTGNRPVNPVFRNLNLRQQSTCTNGQLPNGLDCAGADQLFQQLNEGIDLTNLDPGDYSLEVYFTWQIDGGNGTCQQTLVDDNNGQFYRTGFTITLPLNVAFNQFNGLVEGSRVRLRWTTLNDIDVDAYYLEKSTNGLQFDSIDSIGAQRITGAATYLTFDRSPVVGTNYYRIRSRNQDGSAKLSTVLRIYNGYVGNTLLVFPNPSGRQLDIWMAGVKRGAYRLSVLLSNGQVVHTERLVHDGADRTWRVDLPQALPKGICRIFLIDKYQFYKQSFLVR